MAVPQGDFSKLLRELRSAGPVDRVRLLAKSLAALRGLSPWDRKILLRMAGFEGAEVLVERLAMEDEATGRKLRRLLHELEGRPDEMARTVRALSDPKMRGEALDELLATLDRGLGPEDEAPEPEPAAVRPSPPPAPPPPPTRAAGARAKAKAKPRPAAAGPPDAPAPEASPPATAAPAAGSPAAPAQPAEPARPVPPPPAPEGLDLAPEPEPLPETDSEAALAAEPPRAPAAGREAPPGARTGAPGVADDGPDGSPRTGTGILDRLLDLRRRIAADEPLDASDLRRALETEIPFPWARRRALAAWLESGPPDLGEALALIAELEGATGRSWCLGSLAANGPWTDPEWERIVAAAPTPAARRRLERRRYV